VISLESWRSLTVCGSAAEQVSCCYRESKAGAREASTASGKRVPGRGGPPAAELLLRVVSSPVRPPEVARQIQLSSAWMSAAESARGLGE
jgi:hypothetical protein